LPATFSSDEAYGDVKVVGNDDGAIATFIRYDLNLTRINSIQGHLHRAGKPQCARPLYFQLLLGRSIWVTERADLHMVWNDEKLFVKPLPEYLMDIDIWATIICPRDTPDTLDYGRVLYEDARGLLLSYLWLVRTKRDLQIAHESCLLGSDVTWERWIKFTKALLEQIDVEQPIKINRRFLYGELRLARLNWIFRFRSRKFNVWVRGYPYARFRCSTFVKRNAAWLLTAIVYVTLVLTAMQVGLGTAQLSNDSSFSQACYGFTVFAIVTPLVILACFTTWKMAIFLVNRSARWKERRLSFNSIP